MKKADFSYSGFVLITTLMRKIAMMAAVGLWVLPAQVWANDTRAYSAVSPGIERLDSPMVYPLANTNEGGTLNKVYIALSYAGNAKLYSELCHASGEPCIQIGTQGRQSAAFEGLDASMGFLIKHTVHSWGSSPRPLFIQANLSIWTQ